MHQQTLMVGIPSLIVLVLLIAGAVQLIRADGGPVLAMLAPFMAVGGIACIIALAVAVTTEVELHKRDATIQAQLNQAGINWVRLGRNDDHVVAQAQGCEAEFQIKKEANPGAWPLVSGTGKAVKGCDGMNLDELFVPHG